MHGFWLHGFWCLACAHPVSCASTHPSCGGLPDCLLVCLVASIAHPACLLPAYTAPFTPPSILTHLPALPTSSLLHHPHADAPAFPAYEHPFTSFIMPTHSPAWLHLYLLVRECRAARRPRRRQRRCRSARWCLQTSKRTKRAATRRGRRCWRGQGRGRRACGVSEALAMARARQLRPMLGVWSCKASTGQ